MRRLLWVPVLTLAGSSIGSCSEYDDDCLSDSDCHTGRICRQGQCQDAEGGGETTSSGFGGTASGGSGGTTSGGSGGTTSGTSVVTSSHSTATATTGESPEGPPPSCEGILSGSERAYSPIGSEICEATISFVRVEFGEDSSLVTLDDSSCTLTEVGSECSETAPDTYACGECTFELYLKSTGTWIIAATSCGRDACTGYCCVTPMGDHAREYELRQEPDSPTTSGG